MSPTTVSPDERAAVLAQAPPAPEDLSRAAPSREPAQSEGPRRGRPPLMTRDEVLAQVRAIAVRKGLFRVHFEEPALYARARRLWGSLVALLLAAGSDYGHVIADARRRSADTRRQRSRRAHR